MLPRHSSRRGDRGGRTAPRLTGRAAAGGAAPTRRATLADRLFALRPLLWIPAIALFEAGRTEAAGRWLPPPESIAPLAALLALLAAVHLANGWRDRRGDRLNMKGGAVAAGALSARSLLATGAAALAVAGFLALSPLVSPGERRLLACALLLGIAYVAPAIETKRRPGLDLVSQALGYGVIAFLLGVAAAPGRPAQGARLLWSAAPYALGIATVGVVTMLADRAGDESAGQRTTVVALGERASRSLALGLALLTAAAGLAQRAWVPALWGALALAWLGLSAATTTGNGWNRLAVTLQVAFLILLAARSPVPLAAAVVLGIAAAAYDRSRGGAGYPMRGRERERGEAGLSG